MVVDLIVPIYKAISNRRGIMLPIPKMGPQSKNTLQQSRQRGDPFCVPGKRAGKFAFLSLNPNRSRAGAGPATGAAAAARQDRGGTARRGAAARRARPTAPRRGANDEAEAGSGGEVGRGR